MSKGFLPQERTIPAPDMSFIRLFSDTEPGWQMRGQYAIWTDALPAGSQAALLRRVHDRVARIAYDDGQPVFHEIEAGTPFHAPSLGGMWLTFDTDALWLDTPGPKGRYLMLAVGGTAGKPDQVTVDWTCVRCGKAVAPRDIAIGKSFKGFLAAVHSYAIAVRDDEAARTCTNCGAVHPPVEGLVERAESAPAASETGGGM